MKKKINIVWLKRDLRTFDHRPLYEAEKSKYDYIIIYIFEPSQINYLDFSQRHQQFIYHSILSINEKLKEFNRRVDIFYANADVLFDYLVSEYNVKNVFSYQESGTKNSWNRDIKTKKIFQTKGVIWSEFQKQGVIRGIKNRDGWDNNWNSFMNSPIIKNEFTFNNFQLNCSQYRFYVDNFSFLKKYPNNLQPPGEKYALKYLKSFVDDRVKFYSYNISKPQESRFSCSRLSTYLAWGNISVRFIYQYILNSSCYKNNKRKFSPFISRLKWRSHFIQKFEVDCTYEKKCINKGYERLKYLKNSSLLEKWKVGKTGYPMIDACMRCLISNGWLNFRMRAMLVSFLCHHLQQDWRSGVYHLAKLFLDYEPGIHYTQFQMQAGVTGINSIRVYNPIKQSIEKDPKGVFLKKWLPELSFINTPLIHKPWELTEIDLIDVSIPSYYKQPIISADLRRNKLINQLWALRKDEIVKKESNRIIKTHVRSK